LERIGRTSLGRRALRGERIARMITMAGATGSAERIAGLRILLAVAGGALGFLLGRPIGLVAAPLFTVGGFQVPVVRLSRAARRRQRSIELRVPDLVEVLVATAEAGLAPTVALSRAPGVLHGPLAEEIELVAAEIRLGVPWRAALEHLVQRTDVPTIRRLVVALTRSSRLGSSVRSTLREVADDLRATRRLRAEELARRAPVKMLFPLVFLILPAFLLLTVGPAVLATIRSLQAGG
jgi:tight adherence protein C